MYLIKYKDGVRLEEVDGAMMVRKFPQLTASFLESKLEWYEADAIADHNATHHITIGAGSGTPTKIHCKYFLSKLVKTVVVRTIGSVDHQSLCV